MNFKILGVAAFVAMCMVGCAGSETKAGEKKSTENVTAPKDSTATDSSAKAGADTAAVAQTTPDGQEVVGPDEKVNRAPANYTFRPGKNVPGKLIALTFDDGPSNQTLKILDILRRYNSTATFFVVGEAINPTTAGYMRKAVEQGCEICSHTWNHPYLSTLTYAQTRETINRTNNAIKDAVGYYPNFYRPPYLDADQTVLLNGGMPAMSGLSSDDWVTSHSPQRIVDDVLKLARPNAVIVMHDLGKNSRTPEALKTLIPALQKRGYTLVTVSDLFTSAGVTPQPDKMYSSPNHSYVPAPSTTYRERRKHKSAKGTSTTKSSKAKKSKKAPEAAPAATEAAPAQE